MYILIIVDGFGIFHSKHACTLLVNTGIVFLLSTQNLGFRFTIVFRCRQQCQWVLKNKWTLLVGGLIAPNSTCRGGGGGPFMRVCLMVIDEICVHAAAAAAALNAPGYIYARAYWQQPMDSKITTNSASHHERGFRRAK